MADWFFSKDGQQQGPVTAADLKQMAASGQLRPDDLVWKDGMAQWAKASQLKGVFATPGAAPEAAPGPVAPQVAEAQQSQPIMPQYASPTHQTMQPTGGRSGMALASFICGLIFCFPVTSLLAIIFGIIGIVQTNDNRRTGRGFAIAGLVLGCVGIPLSCLSISIMLPPLNAARQQARQIKSAANEKNIGLAMMMYANANQGQFPPDLITLAKAESLAPDVFVDPGSSDVPAASIDALESRGHNSYIYTGAGLTNPGARTVILYEKLHPNGRGVNVLYGDGSVQFVNKANMPSVVRPGKN
ncbi:MAG TPA: GYF domain-containing protein [Humisphaera sp.]|nr:GYF domain-containing protein [Humisphaera sp.]